MVGMSEVTSIRNLRLDFSEFDAAIKEYQRRLDFANFDKGLKNTFYDLKTRFRTPIYRALAREYYVKQSEVYSSMGTMQYNVGFGNISCWYNFKGVRKSIAGSRKGSLKNGRYRTGTFYAKIVKSGENPLPTTGRRPHFARNSTGSIIVIHPDKFKVENVRPGTKRVLRKRITRAVSLAIPQMPLNRSQGEVEKQILNIAMGRLIHNMSRVIDGA